MCQSRERVLTFEDSSGVRLIHREQNTSGLSVIMREAVSACLRYSERVRGAGPTALASWREERWRYLPELCEGQLGSPHFPLAAKTVCADELQPECTNIRLASNQRKWRAGSSNTPTVRESATYSLMSFSLSKGLLGFLGVLLSESGRKSRRVSECEGGGGGLWWPSLVAGTLTVRVLDWHLEGLIFGL